MIGSADFGDRRRRAQQAYRIGRLAGLPERGWHALRHTFGTHAALFSVNPWRLMAWMGHKRIDETLRYVHMASGHMRELPKSMLEAVEGEFDPDRRVLKMLGARGRLQQPDSNAAVVPLCKKEVA